MASIGRSLKIGIKRRGWIAVQAILAVVGAAWLATEIANFFFPGVTAWAQAHRGILLMLLGTVALGTLVHAAYEPASVSFRIPTTNSTLCIKFGDLFSEQNDILIAVNEFFDGQIGQVVSPHSVHGQFVAKYFHSDAQIFRQSIDMLLPLGTGQSVARSIQPDISYPIGTTIRVQIGACYAYLVALTATDPQTHKASSDISKFWTAATNALESIYLFGNGQPVSMPLIGNGQASLNLPAQQILSLLVLAVVATARKAQLPDKLNIILAPECFEHVDLREVRGQWRA